MQPSNNLIQTLNSIIESSFKKEMKELRLVIKDTINQETDLRSAYMLSRISAIIDLEKSNHTNPEIIAAINSIHNIIKTLSLVFCPANKDHPFDFSEISVVGIPSVPQTTKNFDPNTHINSHPLKPKSIKRIHNKDITYVSISNRVLDYIYKYPHATNEDIRSNIKDVSKSYLYIIIDKAKKENDPRIIQFIENRK
jgi:hypothetical protein